MSKAALFKRQAKDVEINGETFHVRALTMREAMEVDRLKDDKKDVDAALYSVGCCLVDGDGTALFNGDIDSAQDIPLDTLHALGEAIADVSTASKPRDIRKNSDAVPSNPQQ